MGLRPGGHPRIYSAYIAPCRIAFRECGRPSRAFSVSAGHGAAPHARQSAQQPGACARLRDRAEFPVAKRTEKYPVVIVGGGIAGLSAAWRLQKRGFTDFVLLEMNAQPGGNARWGENEITAYPWAAHYVPVPGPRAEYVRELFEDLGVLKNGQWEERYLAFSPQERLFLYGRWHAGMRPAVGLTPKDRDQFQRIENLFNEVRKSGSFTVPLEA